MTKYLKASRHVSLDQEESKVVKNEFAAAEEELLEPGDMLRKLRVQKGLSPQELGEKIGLKGIDIIKMEEGELPIDDQIAKKLGTLFQVDFKAFFF